MVDKWEKIGYTITKYAYLHESGLPETVKRKKELIRWSF